MMGTLKSNGRGFGSSYDPMFWPELGQLPRLRCSSSYRASPVLTSLHTCEGKSSRPHPPSESACSPGCMWVAAEAQAELRAGPLGWLVRLLSPRLPLGNLIDRPPLNLFHTHTDKGGIGVGQGPEDEAGSSASSGVLLPTVV